MTSKSSITLGVLLLILILYQALGVFLLYSSSYFNVVSYYTHPPYKGEIELRRLPLLFGDEIALKILKSKNDEAAAIVDAGEVGMAAILASYEHNQALPQREAKYRSMKIAEFFITAGYDVSRCETDGRSTAVVLQRWGVLDDEIEKFLTNKIGSSDIFSCH